MTSQLNVDTIVDKAGSGGTNIKVGNTATYVSDDGNATQNLVQGLAKAFVNIDVSEGAAFSSDDSFNIASITDSGTGNFPITFTNTMKTSRFSSPAGTYSSNGHSINVTNESTSGTSVRMADNAGSAADVDSFTTITGTMA